MSTASKLMGAMNGEDEEGMEFDLKSFEGGAKKGAKAAS